MKRLSLLLAILAISYISGYASAKEKPIVIITQDGEVDDRSSFVRFLLYTSDVDLRGIIATNSKWQKNGHGVEWIYEAIDLYGQVRGNLLLHRPDYPSADFLKSVTVLGNEDPQYLKGGAPYANSKGADLIVSELLKNDTRPLHVNCWGGANTVAQALWQLKRKHPEEFSRAVKRIRIYCVSFQDEAGNWIKNNIPEAMIIEAGSFHLTWNYHDKEPLKHNPFPEYMSEEWLTDNVKSNHGPLGAWYPQKNISEGDTPAFLGFVDNGLMAYQDYSLGGWGGRFKPAKGNYWIDALDDNNDKKALWRWCPATQNDFAARMDWCVKPFDGANHAPTIEVSIGSRSVSKGEQVELSALASDIDGGEVYYRWWHYKDASGMDANLKIVNETSDKAYFVVPAVAQQDIHIILEVTDDGEPKLTRYRRFIFSVQ
ncbi:DUF1593 domain-containing protein [Pontibacter pamirensis]|uniref:DUF1593 domain-containing protein n=1 Tax=Pontibacter pamirensis TaxID=2562824 RepID=UPI00138A1385|nr:DUF1593 domain-containing protein [Pontibacter pamirensis]